MAVFPCGRCGRGFPSLAELVDHDPCYTEVRAEFIARTGLDPAPIMRAVLNPGLPTLFNLPSAFDLANPEVFRPADLQAGKPGDPVPDHATLAGMLEVAHRRLAEDDLEMLARGMVGHHRLLADIQSALWRGDPAGRARRQAEADKANPGHARWRDRADPETLTGDDRGKVRQRRDE